MFNRTHEKDLETFAIRAGYKINPNPSYCDDTYIDRVYQPDVYSLALAKMAESKATLLIDIGCGQGNKLHDLKCQILGIDYGINLEVCRRTMPQHDWIECNLEREFPILEPELLENSVIVCADVIEHLVDPTMLIRGLTAYSKYAQAIVISTPDRNVVYGYDHSGIPFNPGHVREWTKDEFITLLRRWFKVEEVKMTNVDNVRGELQTLTVVITKKE